MQLVGALARTSPPPRPHARDGVERRCERHAVVTVRPREDQAEQRASTVCDAVPLGALATTVRRVRPRLAAPLLAPMDAASNAARDQSSAPARSSRSSRTRCRRSHTPTVRRGARTDGAPRLTQSRRRRQQAMPEQPNTARGSISQGRPERRTNTIPRRASRSGTRGRPPFGFAGSSGSSGSTTAHISSGTSSCLMNRESTRQ
jgi:hypothetical protein